MRMKLCAISQKKSLEQSCEGVRVGWKELLTDHERGRKRLEYFEAS